MAPVPIFFTHTGNSWYIQFTLRQAVVSNPERSVVLLGDSSNRSFGSIVQWWDSTTFAQDHDRFTSVYRHMSSNSPKNELLCFLRWFTVRNFMRGQKIDRAFLCDTDLMLYADLSPLEHLWEDFGLVLGVLPEEAPYTWAVSPHLTYVSLETLEDFCSFLLSSYEGEILERYLEKWEYHERNALAGGICDMTALYFYLEINQNKRCASIFDKTPIGLYDHNFSAPHVRFDQEFLMRDGVKHIEMADGVPYGQELRLGEKYRFYALHFQGQAKRYLPFYYSGPGFWGQRVLRGSFGQRCYNKLYG